MTEYVYGALPAVDPTTSTVIRNTSGQLFAVSDVGFTTPLTFRDLTGVNSTTLKVGPLGQTDEFRIDDHPQVIWKSGDYVIALWSPVGIMNALEAMLAQQAVLSQQTQGMIDTVQQMIDNGGAGGLPAGTSLDEIGDGTARVAISPDMRTKLQGIADRATRVLIGTDSADQAKPGNWQPNIAELGGVVNKGGFAAVYGRTVAQGRPTAEEGARDGDWLAIEGP